jgi:hypothetical protein
MTAHAMKSLYDFKHYLREKKIEREIAKNYVRAKAQ